MYLFMLYFFPVLIVLSGMIWGVILLRKHAYVKVLPWAMSFAFLVSGIGLFAGGVAYEKHSVWIFSLLGDPSSIFPTFLIWIVISAVGILFCGFFVSAFILICIEKEFIQWEKKYIRAYLLVTMIPTATFLISWFHYKASFDGINMCAIFLVLESINMIVLFIIQKWRYKKGNKTALYIKLGLSMILLCFLIIKKERFVLMWYFSFEILHYLLYTIDELKRRKEENYPKNKTFIKNKKGYVFIEYIPIITKYFSCLLLIKFH